MNLQENIRRILREETQIPTHLRRRLRFEDTLDVFKINSIRFMDDRSVTKAILSSSRRTASSLIPDNEDDDSNPLYGRSDIIDILSKYLISEYGDEIKEYLQKAFPEGCFDDDGYKYVFWKHSERFGGSGFSEAYSTWGKLMIFKGWWFPLNWKKIKSELDKSNQTDLVILKPGDKHNNFGYYFTIRKIKKQ